MVTDQDRPGEGEVDVGPRRIGTASWQSLQTSHVVVRDETHRAAEEIGQVARQIGAIARQQYAQDVERLVVRVGRHLEAIDDRVPGSRRDAPAPVEADERVAPRLFSEGCALEQEDRSSAAEALVQRYRRLPVELERDV